MNTLFGYNIDKKWDYENGYYLTSHPTRIAKLLAHFELYKKIINLPGNIVECGVYKAASLIRFATFRSILESEFSRKIVAFDAFGEFPRDGEDIDEDFIEGFEADGGHGISVEELERVFESKGFSNHEFIKGNVI
ncbi:dTDP-6-deoxy-L-hexose 3-O-methyltransferase, partial [bacterium]|nr:dTDP-6-deoxy-L-hexose 3-O-methyltransferase [bacterium]